MAEKIFNPYEILSSVGTPVDKNSSEDDLKKSYKKACIATHPDRQTGKSDEEKKKAEETFKDVQKAYEILSDPQKKQQYDMFGTIDGSGGAGFNPFSGFSGFDEDIFSMFGGRGRRRTQNEVQPGETIQMPIPVTLEDIYNGVKKTVKYQKKVRCPNCHGSGGKRVTCTHCNGTGHIMEEHRTMFGTQTTISGCPHCHGEGTILKDKCTSCGGTGYKIVDTTLDIYLEPGRRHGEYKIYENGGSESMKPGGPNGKFVAIPQWSFDTSRYTVNGLDIEENIYINYEDAIHGTEYEITLPDGKKVNVKIAPCTGPGKRLLVRGRGIKIPSGTVGNYILHVNYIIPEKLSDVELKALEKIQKERAKK